MTRDQWHWCWHGFKVCVRAGLGGLLLGVLFGFGGNFGLPVLAVFISQELVRHLGKTTMAVHTSALFALASKLLFALSADMIIDVRDIFSTPISFGQMLALLVWLNLCDALVYTGYVRAQTAKRVSVSSALRICACWAGLMAVAPIAFALLQQTEWFNWLNAFPLLIVVCCYLPVSHAAWSYLPWFLLGFPGLLPGTEEVQQPPTESPKSPA